MNMPIQEELGYLLEQHLNNRLTPAERTRFLDLLRREEYRHLLAGTIEELLSRPGLAGPDIKRLDMQQLFEKVISEAASRQVGRAELAAKTTGAFQASGNFKAPRRLRLYYPAAAAVLLFVLAAWLFIRNRQTPHAGIQPQANAQASNRTTHLNNQVLLTLADGSQVPLDSARDGVLALAQKQGGDIVKTGQGDIVYKTKAVSGALAVYNTITTPRGGQYHITLPDNTQVWLNAASSLKFPVAFSGKQRSVTLTGEGYFEVAKDPSRPFTVDVAYAQPTTGPNEKARGMKINVLGTNFNVMAYPNEEKIRTTLLEGSVQLAGKTDRLILKPGEQGSTAATGEAFQLSNPNMQEVIAWKNGEFRFDNTPVTAIMRQVERWYDLSVSYEGNITDLTLSGVISRKEEVTQLMDILEATHKVHFKLQNDRLVVMPYDNKGQ
ncbi:MAG TPA: FecR domain-containing protein [Puia sp.]|jgi:ferric-dicitrate binding protein FerR (iron transport regulator)